MRFDGFVFYKVRHASWVTLCVAEDFCMPIAAYTLDGKSNLGNGDFFYKKKTRIYFLFFFFAQMDLTSGRYESSNLLVHANQA